MCFETALFFLLLFSFSLCFKVEMDEYDVTDSFGNKYTVIALYDREGDFHYTYFPPSHFPLTPPKHQPMLPLDAKWQLPRNWRTLWELIDPLLAIGALQTGQESETLKRSFR